MSVASLRSGSLLHLVDRAALEHLVDARSPAAEVSTVVIRSARSRYSSVM